MHADKIIKSDIERDCRNVIFKLLAETVGQSREAAASHPPLDASLLLAYETPQLIKLDPIDADADHDAIVQLGTADTNIEGQLGNGFAVHASQASGSTHADAFTEGGYDASMADVIEPLSNEQILDMAYYLARVR
jgi:hypothetical protein